MKGSSFLFQLLFVFIFIGCKDNTNSNIQTTNSLEISFEKEGQLSILNKDDKTIKQTIDIEIADNDYEIQTGLMYRSKLHTKHGMLFIFKDEALRYFYMKNTKIPLDIIYINSAFEIVSIQKNAIPFNETSLPSNLPAQYVLEINGGLSDDWGITEGDIINFSKINK